MPKNNVDKDKIKGAGKGGKNAENKKEPLDALVDVPALEFEPEETNLYVFSSEAYAARRGKGPLVTPTYDIMKTSGMKDVYLGDDWKDYLRSTNTELAYQKIVAKDVGPTKGFNTQGKIIFITLVYPGRNVVKILETAKGLDGEQWGRVASLDETEIPGPEINYIDTPQYVHSMYGSNKDNRAIILPYAPVIVPILGASARWIQMKWLEEIRLPKAVTILAEEGQAAYTEPEDLTTQLGEPLPAGTRLAVGALKIAKGGIWGRTNSGWLALRLNDQNPTDWIL